MVVCSLDLSHILWCASLAKDGDRNYKHLLQELQICVDSFNSDIPQETPRVPQEKAYLI